MSHELKKLWFWICASDSQRERMRRRNKGRNKREEKTKKENEVKRKKKKKMGPTFPSWNHDDDDDDDDFARNADEEEMEDFIQKSVLKRKSASATSEVSSVGRKSVVKATPIKIACDCQDQIRSSAIPFREKRLYWNLTLTRDNEPVDFESANKMQKHKRQEILRRFRRRTVNFVNTVDPFKKGINWVESYAGLSFSDFFHFLRIVFFFQLIMWITWYAAIAMPTVIQQGRILRDIKKSHDNYTWFIQKASGHEMTRLEIEHFHNEIKKHWCKAEFYSGPNKDLSLYDYFYQLLTGKLFFGTPLFYGWYGQITRRINPILIQHLETEAGTWSHMLARRYVCSAVTAISFVFIAISQATMASQKHVSLPNHDDRPSAFSHLIFTWDFRAVDSTTIGFKTEVMIYAFIEELNAWKITVKPSLNPVKPIAVWKIWICRIITFIIYAGALVGGYFVVDFMTSTQLSQTTEYDQVKATQRRGAVSKYQIEIWKEQGVWETGYNWPITALTTFFNDFAPATTLLFLAHLFPKFLGILSIIERLPEKTTMIYNVLRLAVFRLMTIMATFQALLVKFSCGQFKNDYCSLCQMGCWENVLSGFFWRIMVWDVFVTLWKIIVSPLLIRLVFYQIIAANIEACKACMRDAFPLGFHVGFNSLDICFTCLISWIGFLTSPGIINVAIVKILLLFYGRLFNLSFVSDSRSKAQGMRTRMGNTIYFVILFILALFGFGLSLFYVWTRPHSSYCGPFYYEQTGYLFLASTMNDCLLHPSEFYLWPACILLGRYKVLMLVLLVLFAGAMIRMALAIARYRFAMKQMIDKVDQENSDVYYILKQIRDVNHVMNLTKETKLNIQKALDKSKHCPEVIENLTRNIVNLRGTKHLTFFRNRDEEYIHTRMAEHRGEHRKDPKMQALLKGDEEEEEQEQEGKKEEGAGEK